MEQAITVMTPCQQEGQHVRWDLGLGTWEWEVGLDSVHVVVHFALSRRSEQSARKMMLQLQ